MDESQGGTVINLRCVPRQPDNSRPAGGFTLIELLVVISIIALLMSILLPTLGSARATAKNMACLSNQRQIGIAFQSYMTTHRDLVPFAHDTTVTTTAEWTWDDSIADELGHTLSRAAKEADSVPVEEGSPILTCPADTMAEDGPADLAIRTYSMPRSGIDFSSDPREARGLGAAPGSESSGERQTRFSLVADVPAPSDTILITEYPRTGGLLGQILPDTSVTKLNLLNLQGRAGVNGGATIESAKDQLESAARDTVGIHSKDRWPAEQNSAISNFETERRFNYLKADGSASSDSPYETAGELFAPESTVTHAVLFDQWTRDGRD